MRGVGQIAGCVLAGWATAAGVLFAQTHSTPQPGLKAVRPTSVQKLAPKLLSADDGLAVLGAALQSGRKYEGRSDCSHLVHSIYEKAGFAYKYQRSSDLYAGIEEFRRVAQPQAGDLIVWPGHAGIVVNPSQHTFYSALRSGFGVQPYDSVYWKGRGRPHFFRYLKAPENTVLAATTHAPSVKRHDAPTPAATNRIASSKASAPAVVATTLAPSLKPAGLRSGTKAGPVPAVVVTNTPMPEDDLVAVASEMQPVVRAIPATVAIKVVRPTPEQVSDALLEQFRETGDTLQSQDVFKLRSRLVAFDQVQVQKVYMKGNSGWADVRVFDTLVLSGEPQAPKKRGLTQRWNLQRSEDGWDLSLPQDGIYIPRESAARILAHQLAALTESNSTSDQDRDQKAQLTRWLSLLLDDPAAR